MAFYSVKLLKKEEIAEGTMAFHFEKPAELIFKAGQNADFKLIDPPEMDAEGPVRTFSFADAPGEPNIMIATRMRDTAFKRILKNTPAGGELTMDGPLGSFTLHNDASKPAVFLIGGIGITPVRSILIDAALRKLPHKIFLFYSNNRPEDAAYLSELQGLEKQNPNYKFIGTMTKMESSQKEWTGERGYITTDMIKRYIPDIFTPIYPHTNGRERSAQDDNHSPIGEGVYYMSGPQAMVAAMRKLLNDAGVNDDYIKTEEFSGY